MPYKDKNTQKSYQKEWYKRKQNNLSTKIINKPKSTKEEITLRNTKNKRRYRNNTKIKIDLLLGTTCYICKSDKRLQCHKKDGKPHNYSFNMKRKHDLYPDVLEHPKDFVRLCLLCHKSVHWAMNYMKMSWEEIIKRHNIY